jgi:hypothetical protein
MKGVRSNSRAFHHRSKQNMSEPLDPKNIDKRTAARHLAQGELDEKAWERYLKSLPDVSDKAAQVETLVADTDDALDIDEDEE